MDFALFVDPALLFARLLLAAVFLVAGVAKLVDRAGTREGIIGFGVPTAVATPGAVLLPLAEIAVAVALLPAATAWWGAAGAAVLLLLFIAGISVNLARGRKPDCHCFGQLYSAPVGAATLVRNGLLAAVAGLVVWQGQFDAGPSALSWLGALTAFQVVGLIGGLIMLMVLAGIGWLLAQLMTQNGRLVLRIEALEAGQAAGGSAPAAAEVPAAPEPGLPVGTPAPAFSLSGLYGETLTLDFLRAAGRPVMLVFSDPGCGPCNALLPELGRWQQDHAGKLTLAVVSRGTPEANRAKSAEHGLVHIVLQHDREVAEAYEVPGTPSAVIVRPDGMIGSPLAAGAEQIRALVGHASGTRAEAPMPAAMPVAPVVIQNGNGNGAAAAPSRPAAGRIGQPAPPIKLPDLTGKTVDLADFRGSKTLVLFWSPRCGFCTRMVDDLKAWEASPPRGAPKLLVVSTGSVEENQALAGLRSPVVLDQGFTTANAFGTSGTPSAVLVDEQGMIASEVAGGAPAVLALAGTQQASSANNGNGNGAHGAAMPATATLGSPAPAVRLPDLSGKTIDLADFRGSRTLVLFWNPRCGFCVQMLQDLKAWEASPPAGAPKLLVISSGSAEENQAMGLRSPIVLDQNTSVMSTFGANGTPMAVLIDEQGKIASEVAAGAPAVLALAGAQPVNNGNGAAIPLSMPAAKVGDPAPEVRLPDLNGKTVDLARYRGTRMLVLFWNPGCGFCQRMLDDLKAWEARPPKGAPKLLVVSSGTVEANQTQGFRSLVVLDQNFTIGSAFGASGTPSAVLVDERGKVASEVAVGAPDVLALARGQQDRARRAA